MVKKLLLSPSPAPEKSTFAQTCNLLSQYLKAGKANLGDISLAAKFDHQQPPVNYKSSSAAAPTTTLDLLPGIGSSSSNREGESGELYDGKPLPRFTGFGSTTTGAGGEGGAQMTIFYGGKVIVFNDFPAEKAKEIMGLVSEQHGISNNKSQDEQINNNNTAAAAASSSSTSPDAGQRIGHLRPPQPRPMGSDLPIARRASLHRFLEKRKDRVTSRGPYHQFESPKAADGDKKNPWIDRRMSQSATQLELSL
ncbi:unnamed protein product [Linum tenue]|uniref:Protein TIFY n=1 Tax=Linum tenue TaxID=586396 RepID=A0AAV0PHN1_9ROSI|nr:unnamed protein product [Linum tenue]